MATILDSCLGLERLQAIAANARALGEPARTAHGITRTGPVHVSGHHLSQAPNESFGVQIEARELDVDAMRRAGAI